MKISQVDITYTQCRRKRFFLVSEIADIAVTESLSTVAIGNDINQSAPMYSRFMTMSKSNGKYLHCTIKIIKFRTADISQKFDSFFPRFTGS